VLIGSTALAGHDLPRASAMSILLLAATVRASCAPWPPRCGGAENHEDNRQDCFLTPAGHIPCAAIGRGGRGSVHGLKRMELSAAECQLNLVRGFF